MSKRDYDAFDPRFPGEKARGSRAETLRVLTLSNFPSGVALGLFDFAKQEGRRYYAVVRQRHIYQGVFASVSY